MLKKIIIITLVSVLVNADVNVVNFYKSALQTLKYNQTYDLYKKSNTLEKKAVTYNRFANFALGGGYTYTQADMLNNPFNTSNVSFNDTIDLFGRSSYKVEELALNLKAKDAVLKIQKESLFASLIDMISAYGQTKEQLSLHTDLLNEQQSMFDKLQLLNSSGAVSTMDMLRFKNSLTLLKTQIIAEKNEVQKMEKKLKLYAPNENIPTLQNEPLRCTKEEYLLADQNIKLNNITAQQLITQSKILSHNYLPDVVAGTSYQKINDPTANGNNYTFNLSFHIPISSGDIIQSQALRAQSLSVKSNDIEYQIQKKNEYINKIQSLKNAKEQLAVLQESLPDYLKSEQNIKKAFLRQYVDFNTYLQVLTQTLFIQEQIIKMRYQKNSQIIFLNNLASGIIYE